MADVTTGLIIGFMIPVLLWIGFRLARKTSRSGSVTEIRSSLDSFKAIGELVVLKVFTQQIVTRTDHLLGDWGEKWMAWILSSKKTAMIFDFVVDFRYDLKSPDFSLQVSGPEEVEFKMPPCFYEIQMKDIRIYDEKAAALVPLLLPEWLGQIFGGKFSEKEKNELIKAARQEAEGLAKDLTDRMLGEVRSSAESTLRPIARSMGYSEASFVFDDRGPVQGSVDLSRIEASANEAVDRTGTEG